MGRSTARGGDAIDRFAVEEAGGVGTERRALLGALLGLLLVLRLGGIAIGRLPASLLAGQHGGTVGTRHAEKAENWRKWRARFSRTGL